MIALFAGLSSFFFLSSIALLIVLGLIAFGLKGPYDRAKDPLKTLGLIFLSLALCFSLSVFFLVEIFEK